MNKKENGLSHIKNDVLCQLRCIARSETIQESEEAIKAFKQSNAWKNNPKFSVHFMKYWLKIKEVNKLKLVIFTSFQMEQEFASSI